MAEIELFNMCMIYNLESDEVLVLDKVGFKWTGLTFPGGKIDNGEGIVDSTIREVKEETGLDVTNLKYAGLIHWYNTTNHKRWLVFLYKTNDFSGQLLEETVEGKISWMQFTTFKQMQLAPNMKEYLKLFTDDTLTEAFATWKEDFRSGFKFV